MDIGISNATSAPGQLPAQRIDERGRAHVDLRAVVALALPLVANSAVQTVLSLTDVWFIGHISTKALAGVSAVHWLVLVVVLVLSGIGMAVQTIVSQAYGSRRFVRASQATWIALWGTVCATPLFLLAGFAGGPFLHAFDLDPDVERQAIEFWIPRVGGAPLGAAVWATLGFFNGIGNPRLTVIVSLAIAVANAIFNYLFVFHFEWGVAGSAWATNVAQAFGLLLAMSIFLQARFRKQYRSHLMWRPRAKALWRQLKLGFPMGLVPAADLIGFAIFQIMLVQLSPVDGAASQLVMMVTSIAYMPGIGIALAGTTLVGQSIGAGDRDWAMRVGTRVIVLTSVVMGGLGLLLALVGPWLIPLFAGSHDADAAAVMALGTKLLWFGAVYQLFDGFNLGSGFCLRGAGDATVPAILVLAISWLIFVPLAHVLIFAPGEGWVDFLPATGGGAIGGWGAVVVYMVLLGVVLFARWRSGAWRRIYI